MATDITTPKPPPPQQGDPDRPTGKALPLLLLIGVVGLLGAGVWAFIDFVFYKSVKMSDSLERQFVLRRFSDSVRMLGKDVDPYWFWIPTLGIIVGLGLVYVCWMYYRDGKAVGWAWASFLATCRCAVYLALAGIFLMPALQDWDKKEDISRVIVLIDTSGSMFQSDEIPEEGKSAPPTRMDQVLTLLNAEAAKGEGKEPSFLKKLEEKNPVVVYQFGGKLDDEFKEFVKNGKDWTAADWTAWLKQDLKQWALDDLSPIGQKIVRESDGFEAGKPGTPDWAAAWLKEETVPAGLTADDKEKLDAKRKKMAKKIELRQMILDGTNYGDSVLGALTREANNMLAGIIIIGDGQSNQGSPSTFDELRRRAKNLKVPVYTVGIGEYRELVNIRITELQVPNQAPPDDQLLGRVEIEGEGLADKEAPVTIDIYKPGDPMGQPSHQFTLPVTFKKAGGGVPRGQVEFIIDPSKDEFAKLRGIPEQGSVKPELAAGEWKFVARVPKAKGEAFAGKEHVSDPTSVQIVKRPLRVLLFAGGPTREYQFARRLFVNETDLHRAELSIHLQVADQSKPRVQDVPNERLLKTFPTELRLGADSDKPEDRYYNLAQYDLIIAFDPDWTQLSLETLTKLQKWVDEGGGLILVGGPINTFQLARLTNFEKLRPIVELYPVNVEDSRLAGLGVERQSNKPWRLNFPKATAEANYLKLDEDEKRGLLDGWEEFFTSKMQWAPPQPGDTPTRGFFSFYPVKSVKPTATTVATFGDPQARMLKEQGTEDQPYLVTMPYGKGKVFYLSSGEMWRLRLYKEVFHERFWTKLGRVAAAGSLTRQTKRGTINLSRTSTVGRFINFDAKLVGTDLNPLPANLVPEVRIIPPANINVTPNPIKMTPNKEGQWAGRFNGRFQAPAPGEYQLELQVPGSGGEIIREKILIKESNPELDNPRPNFALLRNQLASNMSELRIADQAKAAELRRQLKSVALPEPGDKGATSAPADAKDSDPPLFFDQHTARVIPDYVSSDRKLIKSRGAIKDLWPQGPEIALFGKQGPIGLMLLIIVGLLSAEWLTRKLLRLA